MCARVNCCNCPLLLVSNGLCMLQGSKDASQHVLQTRISNARLLAELVKFRLIPLGNFFTLLKVAAPACHSTMDKANLTVSVSSHLLQPLAIFACYSCVLPAACRCMTSLRGVFA